MSERTLVVPLANALKRAEQWIVLAKAFYFHRLAKLVRS